MSLFCDVTVTNLCHVTFKNNSLIYFKLYYILFQNIHKIYCKYIFHIALQAISKYLYI